MNRRLDLLPPLHDRQEPDGAAIGMAALLLFSVLYFAGHFLYWWIWGVKNG